jgi:transposase-like protein
MGKRYKAKDRERLVQAVLAGEPVRAVAERLGVTTSTGYLWVKQARKDRVPRFARLVPADRARSALGVKVGQATIRVEPGFDAVLLREIVSALSGPTR